MDSDKKAEMRGLSPSFLVCVACSLVACGSTVRHAVDYRGDEFAPRKSASELASVAVLPVGFESFGVLVAHCTETPMDGPLEGAWLSDVDCSERRLRAALRQKAAEVGAELLVGERCGASPAGPRTRLPGMRCSARAARPDQEGRARRPLGPPAHAASSEIADADRAAALDDPTGEQAWRIEIRYEPASNLAPRTPRPAQAVGELPALPVSHVSLGLLESRCAAECSVDAVRAALRVAAGRLGASDVAEVRCVEYRAGITCLGTAAEPEAEL